MYLLTNSQRAKSVNDLMPMIGKEKNNIVKLGSWSYSGLIMVIVRSMSNLKISQTP